LLLDFHHFLLLMIFGPCYNIFIIFLCWWYPILIATSLSSSFIDATKPFPFDLHCFFLVDSTFPFGPSSTSCVSIELPSYMSTPMWNKGRALKPIAKLLKNLWAPNFPYSNYRLSYCEICLISLKFINLWTTPYCVYITKLHGSQFGNNSHVKFACHRFVWNKQKFHLSTIQFEHRCCVHYLDTNIICLFLLFKHECCVSICIIYTRKLCTLLLCLNNAWHSCVNDTNPWNNRFRMDLEWTHETYKFVMWVYEWCCELVMNLFLQKPWPFIGALLESLFHLSFKCDFDYIVLNV
jgi:hypothetical protein